jgi:hypothetical protein
MMVHTGPIAATSSPAASRRRSLTDRQRLRERERNRGVDGDAAVGGFLDGAEADARGRDLHDDVRCEPGKLHGLLHNGSLVTV